MKVRFRRRGRGVSGNGALGEFGTLLRLVFGSAAATVAAYLDGLDPAKRSGSARTEGAGSAIMRLCRELAAAKSRRDALISVGALAPIALGMHVGQKLRDRIKPETFKRLVLVAVLVSGLELVRRAVLS